MHFDFEYILGVIFTGKKLSDFAPRVYGDPNQFFNLISEYILSVKFTK